jgi:cephalosporin hydroxylase
MLRPFQIKEEILKLLELLKDMEPRVVLEIGTAEGGTLFLFTRVASSDAIIISIDLPGGMFGGGYPVWKIPLYKSFAREKQKIYLIRADSHSYKTLDKVKEILNGRNIDFLFIDGDHTYEGVKKDFEMYSPLVKKGIIAFHDIVQHPPETGCEVSRFWNEIKYKYKYREIVKDWNQKWAGIGVLYV